MGSKKIDKTKVKNWEAGDVFVLKIENTNTEYDGRYIILIKVEKDMWYKDDYTIPVFRAKITDSDKIPDNLNEIDNLEYVKTNFRHYIERFFPLSGNETYDECVERKKNIKYYKDEYNYMYIYKFTIKIRRKDKLNKLKYLGNYEVKEPEDEYMIDCQFDNSLYLYFDEVVTEIIKCFEEYNLRKSEIYTNQERIKLIEKNANDYVNITNNAKKIALKMRKIEEDSATEEEYKRKMKQLFFSTFSKKMPEEDNEDYYHETYVGRDILTSDEKLYDDENEK